MSFRICDSKPYQSAVATAVDAARRKATTARLPADAVAVHAQIEPAKVNEDHDVGHVEAVADAAIEGQRAAAQHGVDRIARAGGGDQGQHRAGKADRQRGIEKGSAAGDGGRGRDAQRKAAQAHPEPDAAAEWERMQAQRQQAAQGDAVQVNQCVGGREPGSDGRGAAAASRPARQTRTRASIHGRRRKRTSGAQRK